MGKVLVIDTSILCVWLGVPDKETCGPEHDKWTRIRVDEKIRSETGHDVTFVLPLASRGFSLGDATIKDVADYYSVSGFVVEILTGDQELKAYEPLKPVLVPRRRQR